MERTKAAFKALRERVGMSQNLLADAVGVRVLTVKRWEHPTYQWTPPEDAWAVLVEAAALQMQVVGFAVDKAVELHKEIGSNPMSIELPYWFSANSYGAAHHGEGYKYQMANANIRMAAFELEAMGYNVRIDYGGGNIDEH